MEKLSKNFIWMAAANIISGLFGVVLFLYLARTLEPEAFGYISYAFTMVFFLANFVDLGLSTYGMREIAKDMGRASDYASEIISFRTIMALILLALFAIAIILSPVSITLKIIILESMLMLFVFSLSTEWAFQGLEKMHMVFISFLVTSTLQISLIFLFVKGPRDLVKTPVLYFIAALPIILLFLKRLNFRILLKASDLKRMESYLTSSLVIWAIALFAQVYNGLDIFILGFFRRIEEVGCFSVARRVVGSLAVFGIFLANAVLPRLSSTFRGDIAQFKSAMHKFLAVLSILSAFIILPLIIFSKEFISLAFGNEYISASVPLRMMLVGLLLVLFNMPYSTGLIAAGLEKKVLFQAIACALVSVVANFALIPKYGMVGASISFIAAEALALVWVICVYERRLKAF